MAAVTDSSASEHEQQELAATGATGASEVPYDKFKFYLDDLVAFIFPKSLQHPLAAGRLIAFGLYGPLDDFGQIRTGPKGSRILAEYELEQMCLQIEKEDILQIYLHRSRDMGMLSSKEQEMIISQADAHLKRASGKASLPRLWKKDIYDIFKNQPLDEYGRLSFHEAQTLIEKWRAHRVQEFKKVYPSIVKSDDAEAGDEAEKLPSITAGSDGGGGRGARTDTLNASGKSVTQRGSSTKRKGGKGPKRIARVGESVAPPTMFLKMQGLTPADTIEKTTKTLSKHAFKITDLDARQSSEITSNVRLLREIPPYCVDPYAGTGREKWDQNSTMKGVSLGSLVKAPNSTSTWKRKVTLY